MKLHRSHRNQPSHRQLSVITVVVVVVAVNDGGGHDVSRGHYGGRCGGVVRFQRWAAGADASGGGRHGADPRHHVRVPTASVHSHRVRTVRVLRCAHRTRGHLPQRQAYRVPPLPRWTVVRTRDHSRLRLCGRPVPRQWQPVADVRRQSRAPPPAQEDQICRATVTAVMMNVGPRVAANAASSGSGIFTIVSR